METFNLFYTPHNPGNYVIKIKFGGQDIPGGDFVITVGCRRQTPRACLSSTNIARRLKTPILTSSLASDTHGRNQFEL